MQPTSPLPNDQTIVAAVQRWLERAVIGLNLCPFAKAVHVKQQIRYRVSHATSIDALLDDLAQELDTLVDTAPEQIDTTLLIVPSMLEDFLDYNDFLNDADDLLDEKELHGVIQIATFHPDYQFAGTTPDDIENFTNRSPVPILHLLREESLDKAVAAFPEAETIFERNILTMQSLGQEGWDALNIGNIHQENNLK